MNKHNAIDESYGSGGDAAPSGGNETVFYVPADKLTIMFILAGLGSCLAGVSYIVTNWSSFISSSLEVVVASAVIAASPVGVISFLSFFFRFLFCRPALIVDKEKLVDQSLSFLSCGHISLADVYDVEYTDRKYGVAQNRRYRIFVREPSKYFSSNPLKRKFIDEYTNDQHGTPVVIPAYLLNIDPQHLVCEVHRRIKARSAS